MTGQQRDDLPEAAEARMAEIRGSGTWGSSLTVSLWRPLARRRASTARPSAVFMRTRKPCVLARLRLFGWKVRFGIALSFDYRPFPSLNGVGGGLKACAIILVGNR